MTFEPSAPLDSVTTNRAFSLAGGKQLLAKPYKNKFVRNLALVAAGTAEAQAITMAFASVITRLYGPEAAFTIIVTNQTLYYNDISLARRSKERWEPHVAQVRITPVHN